MSVPVPYVAELRHVREASIAGTADLAFWKDVLKPDGVSPVEVEGKAQILIGALASSYMLLPFRELTLAVRVRPVGPGIEQEGVFLAQAFNSSRLFAFSERTFFSTPYLRAKVDLEIAPRAAIRLCEENQTVLGAEMDPRDPERHAVDGWEGPVYLPGGELFFFAKLSGVTDTYAFSGKDALTVKLSSLSPFVGRLQESHFKPQRWSVRGDATHDRSKTYPRSNQGLRTS